MADRKVRFRRIGGRVVPIRSKRKGSPSHKVAAVGVGAYAGGTALGKYSVNTILKGSGFTKPESSMVIHKRHEPLLRKLRFGLMVRQDFKPWEGSFLPKFDTIIIGEKSYPEVFEHELGHAISGKKKLSVNKIQNWVEAKLHNKYRRTHNVFNKTVNPFLRLGSEAEASHEAMKMIRKRLGKDTVGIKKARRFLRLGYGSYVGTAAKTAGVGLVGVAALMKAREQIIKRRNK